jgi:TrwC relaxase
MSLHKLTAGSGYDYLTRQVAALDATEKGHVGLAAYYTERGESPGVWVGSGMDGIEGVDAADPVTAEQMRNLFGCGLHPLADVRAQQFGGSDFTLDTIEKTMRLGTPFRVFDEATRFRVEVAKRIADLNAYRPRTAPPQQPGGAVRRTARHRPGEATHPRDRRRRH